MDGSIGSEKLDELKETFEFLEDWTEKYSHLIELGKAMPPLDVAFKTDVYKVQGCMSQVWLVADKRDSEQPIYDFRGDSDALIVKGLVALVLMIFSGKTANQIESLDEKAIFSELGLDSHLSIGRRNGLESMVLKIKSFSKRG